MKALNTPVLFLVFNRPDTTKLVFERIRAAQPTELYIAADGPRTGIGQDPERTEEVRRICTTIDWDCKVHTLFRDMNLGCGKAVSEGISWFFDHVDEGIILEDDTLPTASFFYYCETLLKRYRDVNNVMIISGNNFQEGIKRGDGSYYFSKYVHIWGWATWKRTWELYDFDIKAWEKARSENDARLFADPEENEYWKNIFDKIYNREIDTWDYQLFFFIPYQ